MKVEQIEGSHAKIQFSVEDLALLNNSLNEVCNGIHVDEFELRLGTSREYAKKMLEQLGQLVDQLSLPIRDDV